MGKHRKQTGIRQLGPAITCLCALLLFVAYGPARADVYEIPDAELLNSEFGQLSSYSGSSSTLDGKDDVAGPGVVFSITLAGPDSGKIGIGDPWPTNSAAEFGWDSVLGHWTSLAAYDAYSMTVAYTTGPADSDVDVSLIMNTGLTGPSGNPSSDLTNDTFWQSDWMTLALGEEVAFTLDFDSAQAWNISDNKVPHTGGGEGWADGGTYAINERDRNEVSNIGLQVADFDGDALGNQVGLHLNVPEPTVLSLLCLSGLGLLRRRRSGRLIARPKVRR